MLRITQKILRLITASFLSALDKNREIDETYVKLLCGGYVFTTKAKVVAVDGFKKISDYLLGKENKSDDGDDNQNASVVEELRTKPPVTPQEVVQVARNGSKDKERI